ncbi:TetR/AcrR family transcriptional regulator [Arthrobacter sp. UM1]|nr:TetR/AcrR family transcriptional regulator [Arthrobacter sp. UM1]
MKLVREKDYRALTMPALAGRLGVSSSAIYNHVSSKQEILVLIQERLNASIDCTAFETEPWDRALHAWAHSYRRRFIEHTDLIPVVAVLPVADSPETLKMYERVSQGLAEAGLAEADIVDVIVGVEALVFGAAYDASAPADIFSPGSLEELAPTFSRLTRLRTEDARTTADRAFELALTSLIAGLRERVRVRG